MLHLGRLEEGPFPAPSVAAEGTLLVGAGGVPQGVGVAGTRLTQSPLLLACITFPEFSPHSQHKALVDSGAGGIFNDRSFVHSLGIPLVPVDLPFPVHALDSRPLGSGLIMEATAPLGMVKQEGHKERISLFLIDSPAFPVVQGQP